MPRAPIVRPVSSRVTDHVRPGVAPRAAASARRRAEALVGDVLRRKKRIASDFYEIGQALAELSEPAAYEALGCASFEELLRRRKLMSRIQAYKLIDVARVYPKQVALKLGIEKAYALHRHVVATPAADVAVELARRNARIGGKPLAKLTVDELRDATRRLKRGPATPGVTPADRARAREVQRELRRRGARSAVVRAEPDAGGAVLVVRIAVDDSHALLPR